MTVQDKLLQLNEGFKRFEAQKDSAEFFSFYVYPKMKDVLNLIVDNTPPDEFMQKWKNVAVQEVQLDIEQTNAPDFSQKSIIINTRWLDSYKKNIEDLITQFIEKCEWRCPEVLSKEIVE